MGNARGRLLFAVGLALVALAPFGTATAAPSPRAETAVPSDVRYTTLVAGGGNLLGLNLKPRAKLTDTVTGAPLAGMHVNFFLNNNELLPPLCGGVTNAAGVASCGGLLEHLYVIQSGGFEAQFGGQDVGDIYYRQSIDMVGLLGP